MTTTFTRGALITGALLLTNTAKAQNDFDSLDALDADLSGAAPTSETEARGPRLSEFRGQVSEEFRIYPADREGRGNDQQLLSEVQLDFDFRVFGGLHAVVSPWFLIDALDTDLLRYEPLEAYLIYQGGSWDILGGQFIESWGIADTANPLDVLNRRDFATDFLDPEPRGELGARGRIQLPGGEVIGEPTLSLYALPLFRRTDFPTDEQRASFSGEQADFREDLSLMPSGFDQVAGALRFDSTLNTSFLSADIQLLAIRGPSHTPLITPFVSEEGELSLLPSYYGEWVLGGGFRAVPEAAWWSKFTLKAELAYKRPYALDYGDDLEPGSSLPSTPGHYFQYVAGFDRSFPQVFSDKDEFTLTVEYAGEVGPKDEAAFLRPFDADIASRLAWSAGDFARTTVEVRGIFDVTNGEIIAEAFVARQLRFVHDDLKLELGGRYLRASPSESTLLAAFPTNNSLAYSRLQFDF